MATPTPDTDTSTTGSATTATATAYKTITDLIGPTLYMKKKKKTSTNAKKDSKQEQLYTIETCPTISVMDKSNIEYVLLYFSASWCPPCQSFTPILADFYTRYKEKIEIIYISSDRDITEFITYYTQKMPYYTIHPFDSKASDETDTLRRKLPTVFSITGLPTLIVLNIQKDNDCVKFVTNTARMDILENVKDYDKVWAKWKSTPTPQLLSIEEGVKMANRGDGSLFSIISKIFQTLLEKPIYIFGIFYIWKFYGRSIHKLILNLTGSGGENDNNSTAIISDDPMFESVPEDEF